MVKKVVMVPYGGLGNRVYAMASAVEFCKDKGARLEVLWFKDKGLAAGFYELFTRLPPHLLNYVSIKDAKWYHFFYERPRKKNLWITWIYLILKFDALYLSYMKKYYTVPFLHWFQENIHENSFYVTHCNSFYHKKSIGLFQPIDEIKLKISNMLNTLPLHTLGIHIRRTDHLVAINRSPLNAFIEKMKHSINENPDVAFYVASDSPNVKKEVLAVFGTKIFLAEENNVRRDTKIGIQNALAELFILAATEKIYGSAGSTFSALAAEINGIPLEICKQINAEL
jgi:hypothetical protein